MKSGSILAWWSALGIFVVLRHGDFALACLWAFGLFAVGEWLGMVAFKAFPLGRYKVFIFLHPPFVGVFPAAKLEPRVIRFFGEENMVLVAFGRFPIHVLGASQ